MITLKMVPKKISAWLWDRAAFREVSIEHILRRRPGAPGADRWRGRRSYAPEEAGGFNWLGTIRC